MLKTVGRIRSIKRCRPSSADERPASDKQARPRFAQVHYDSYPGRPEVADRGSKWMRQRDSSSDALRYASCALSLPSKPLRPIGLRKSLLLVVRLDPQRALHPRAPVGANLFLLPLAWQASGARAPDQRPSQCLRIARSWAPRSRARSQPSGSERRR